MDRQLGWASFGFCDEQGNLNGLRWLNDLGWLSSHKEELMKSSWELGGGGAADYGLAYLPTFPK